MRSAMRPWKQDARGFALLTVMIFALVLTIAGMLFFNLATGENRQAMYRQRSSEAFYLADGAVEQARAKFLQNRSWWLPPGSPNFTGTTANGTFDCAVIETTIVGEHNTVNIVANGHVRGAHRRIKVTARVPPTTNNIPLFVGGDFDAGGKVCIEDSTMIHVNGGGDDQHVGCGGTLSSGFDIYPPPIYTEPDSFPAATYYTVRGYQISGGVYGGQIWRSDGVQIPVPDNMQSITSYNNGSKTYTFNFGNSATINAYFNDAAGYFQRQAGTIAAVVNFGDIPLYPGSGQGMASVSFDGSGSSSIHATIINTRYVGGDRLQPSSWTGGIVTVKQITFEPYYGAAMLIHNFQQASGGSNVYIGTETHPALVYVTADVGSPGSGKLNSNFYLHGSIVCLGNWYSTGSPQLDYDSGFVDNLPGFLDEGWTGGSGTMKVLAWREVRAN